VDNLANWALFLIVNGLALYAAYCFSGYFLRRSLSSDTMPALSLGIAASGIIYFAHITLIVLFLGVVLKYLNLYSVVITSVLVSIAMVYRFRRDFQPFRQPLKQSICRLLKSRDYFLFGIILLFIIQVIILAAKIIILPPHVWDVFAYHLTPAVEWYQQGLIPAVIDTPVHRINAQPLGMTVLSYWSFIFFRDDFLVELPSLLWALLLVPVSYAAMRLSNVSEAWSQKFAILIFFIPVVLMQAVSAKDHLGLNIGFFAALLFITIFLKSRDYKMLLLAATAFGLMLGYKLSAPLYPITAFIFLMVFIVMNDRKLLLDSVERLALIKTLAVSGLIMILIGGYWYIRNLWVSGSFIGVLNIKDKDAFTENTSAIEQPIQVTELFQFSRLIGNIKEFIPRIFDYQSLYGADLPGMSGFGPQFAAFGILAMIAAVAFLFIKKYRYQPVNFMTWSALALLLIYFIFYYSSNNYRVFSFLPMIMIAYAAVVLHWLGMYKNKLSAALINLVIVVSMGWNIYHVLPPSYTNKLALKEFVTLDAPQRTSANYTQWFSIRPSMYQLIGDFPVNEPIAYVSKFGKNFAWEVADDTWSYLYYDRNWKRRIKYLDQNQYLNCNKNAVCQPSSDMKTVLSQNKISLVSVCKVNVCLTLNDPDFVRLVPGLYYYAGRKK